MRHLKCLLVLFALTCLAAPVFAVEPPPCWPAPVGKGSRPYTSKNDIGFAVLWYCKAADRWLAVTFYGHWSELPDAMEREMRLIALTAGSDADREEAWRQGVTNQLDYTNTVKPLVTQLRLAHDAQYSSLPKLVVSSNVAYRMRQASDGFEFLPLGTIALGTLCDATAAPVGDYYLVPRGAVKMASIFDTKPLVVFGRCGNQ